MHGHSVDFFIRSHNIYVEFDGVYWHGLNRPLEQIRQSQTKRDVSIFAKWQDDRQFDVWCKNNNLNLIRITDEQFRKNDLSVLPACM